MQISSECCSSGRASAVRTVPPYFQPFRETNNDNFGQLTTEHRWITPVRARKGHPEAAQGELDRSMVIEVVVAGSKRPRTSIHIRTTLVQYSLASKEHHHLKANVCGTAQAFLQASKLPDSTARKELYVPDFIHRRLSKTSSAKTGRDAAESDAELLQQNEIKPIISRSSMPFSRQREVLQTFLAARFRSISVHSMPRSYDFRDSRSQLHKFGVSWCSRALMRFARDRLVCHRVVGLGIEAAVMVRAHLRVSSSAAPGPFANLRELRT